MIKMVVAFFSSFTAIAAPSDQTARVFELRVGNRTSHLVANHEGYRPAADANIRPLTDLAKRACNLILYANPRAEPTPITFADQMYRTDSAVDHGLSAGSVDVIRYLVREHPGKIPHYLAMRPGVAQFYLRTLFRKERRRRWMDYQVQVARGVGIQRAYFDENLLAVAREVYGESVDAGDLYVRAKGFLRRHSAPKGAPLADLIAGAFAGRSITALDHLNDPSRIADVVTTDDLDRTLIAMGRALAEINWTTFWNVVLAQTLEEDLTNLYFTLPTATFARLRTMIYSNHPAWSDLLPGEERTRAFVMNAHHAWVPTLLEHVRAGGALAVLAAAHVLPGIEPYARRPLLDEFRHHGVTVRAIEWKP